MKGIIWVSVFGVVFWWMAISSSSRQAVYRGSYYFVARVASALGLPAPRLTPPPARPDPRAPAESPEKTKRSDTQPDRR
ncbi:MAG TPA: hypothetical protein VFL57_17305 [Bryobacteraceae bacterium]|nr:hypothetical protein [Bryobacteraceae bacterium]